MIPDLSHSAVSSHAGGNRGGRALLTYSFGVLVDGSLEVGEFVPWYETEFYTELFEEDLELIVRSTFRTSINKRDFPMNCVFLRPEIEGIYEPYKYEVVTILSPTPAIAAIAIN